jgi:hypothetical protein
VTSGKRTETGRRMCVGCWAVFLEGQRAQRARRRQQTAAEAGKLKLKLKQNRI